jgi:predicted nucleotide-binding protein
MSAAAEEPKGRPPDGDAIKGNEFPKATLEESLRVAQAIESANAGQPYPPLETANAMGLSPASSHFRTLLSASARRGLTAGSHMAKRISVLDTGRDIVAPTDEDSVGPAIRRAALTPPVFQAIYNHYRGKKLPDDQYLINTLTREFAVPAKDATRCAKIFRADMEYAGLLVQTKTGLFLTDNLETAPVGRAALTVVPAAEDADDDEGSLGADASEVPPAITPAAPAHKPQPPKAIFIGHGPSKTPVNQLTKMLDELGLPYKVAEYEPNAGRPISQKVADLMDECGAAILIFTADRELRDLDGNPVWLSSENVSNELGAATVLYNGRVVIFKEQGVELASNYSGIGYIEFEKNKLSAHAMELFREVRFFGLIKISVGE